MNFRALASLFLFLPEGEPREMTERLWRFQWKDTLDHIHLPTGQLAGPHGRAYGRDMLRHTHGCLKFHVHQEFPDIFPLGVEADGGSSDLHPALITADPPCPADLAESFRTARAPRAVVRVVDSCDFAVGLAECRKQPPFWKARGTAAGWDLQIQSKGNPRDPSFRGAVKKTTTWLGPRICLGTVNVEAMGFQSAPLIAHWPQTGRSDRANFFTAMVLARFEGNDSYLPGGVLCLAQSRTRVLGLLRFEADAEDGAFPSAPEALLAFQVNLDSGPEVRVDGRRGAKAIPPGGVATIEADGVCAAVRLLAADVPGAEVSGVIGSVADPYGVKEGGAGFFHRISPLRLAAGQSAFVAFALELAESADCGGATGLAESLRSAPVRVEKSPPGRVRLDWDGFCRLEASTLVAEAHYCLTPEGAVEGGPVGDEK